MRQILCYWCSVRVFVDEAPSGSFPPPHCCLACRGSWPPTEAEEKFRRAREHEWSTRQRERKGRGKPIFRVIGKKLSKEAVRNLRIQERQEEILSKPLGQLTRPEKEWLIRVDRILHHRSAGRPREDQYDEWLAKKARADVLGIKRPTIEELAGVQRPDPYRDRKSQLRDALKKAKKRRQIPVPPMT
jgi:hypothetical protein